MCLVQIKQAQIKFPLSGFWTVHPYLDSCSKSLDFFLGQIVTRFARCHSNPLQRPYSGDFDPGNAYRKPPVILQNSTKSHLCRLNLALFPCSQWRADIREHRPITEKHFQNQLENYNEAKKKVVIGKHSEMLLKYLVKKITD